MKIRISPGGCERWIAIALVFISNLGSFYYKNGEKMVKKWLKMVKNG
jgi:hypothetical protein